MKLVDFKRIVTEAFNNRIAQEGTVKFSTSQLTDPHIRKVIQYISQQSGKSPQAIAALVQKNVDKMADTAKLVPSLYKTMLQNAVESEVFNLMWRGIPGDDVASQIGSVLGLDTRTPVGVDPVGPKFSDRVFIQLVRFIKADHDEFFPLRGFVDRRVLMNEGWVIVPSTNPQYEKWNDQIDTAAATPNGTFIFNRHFCQKLLDYAHLKGIQGNGNKYVSNGGPIPDEYAYIEFLILHELMHFSNDDFYYQHIIPNANGKIINWVGDFRSNYLLVKSGYAQLPMGLYNDSINYDRQSEYIQMYRIVEAEMKKLNPDEQKEVGDAMDGQGDDHEPGQEEGKKGKPAEDAKGKSAQDIDKNADRVNDEVSQSNDSDTPVEPGQGQAGANEGEGEGDGNKRADQEIDYKKVTPAYSWQAIAKKFVASAQPKPIETYSKPHRRAATSADMIAQTGAGAIKPAEKPSEHADVTLMFVVDSSGSMSQAIAMAYANIASLLKQPAFKKSDVIITRFSSDFDMHKGNFASNKAAPVTDVREKPKNYTTTVNAIFNSHMGYSTNFAGKLVEQIMAAMKMKYNVLIFSDSDIFYGKNLDNLKAVIAASPKQVFVLFDKRETYIRYRQTPGAVVTPNISHM